MLDMVNYCVIVGTVLLTVDVSCEEAVNKIEFVPEDVQPNSVALRMTGTSGLDEVGNVDIDVTMHDMISRKGRLSRLHGPNRTFVIDSLKPNTYYGITLDGHIEFDQFQRKHIQYIFIHTPQSNSSDSGDASADLVKLTPIGSLLTGDLLLRLESQLAKQIDLSTKVTFNCNSKTVIGPSVQLYKSHYIHDVYINKTTSEYDLPSGFPEPCSQACANTWIMFIDPALDSLQTFKAPAECTKIKLVYKALDELDMDDYDDDDDDDHNHAVIIKNSNTLIFIIIVLTFYLSN